MTKQEEIREELARRIAIRDSMNFTGKSFIDYTTCKYTITLEQYGFADRILQGLHWQGVEVNVFLGAVEPLVKEAK